MSLFQVAELIRSNWGAKTLEDFRLESERHPEGGVFEALRDQEDRRILIVLCVTQPADIAGFVTRFGLIDDGVGEDWKSATLLDLFMGAAGHTGLSFSCLRDPDGKRRALIFLAMNPSAVAMIEQVFGLDP